MSENMIKAREMIDRFVSEKGINVTDVYDEQKNIWYLKRGSANVQVGLLSVPIGEGRIREFVQAAAPLMKVPSNEELKFYRKLLELNDVKLGVKLSVQAQTDIVWAIAERDLVGMDYKELETCLEDLGFWADELDDMLVSEFQQDIKRSPME